MKNRNNVPHGFTLIKLMVVASIIVILMMIGGLYYDSARKTSRDNQRKADLRTLSVALETYYSRFGKYPDENYNADGCDSSVGSQCATNPITNTSWNAASDLQDLITEKIINKLPNDPANKTTSNTNYIYIFELDQPGEGSPSCSDAGDTACRYILQTLLEKENCIYTLTGGYGLPNSIDLKAATPDCEGNVVPTGWAGKPCCAQ